MSKDGGLQARGPYQAAIVPEIATRDFHLDPEVAAEAADALLEITRFDAELPATELAPLAAVLLRTESVSSSQIENVTAGAEGAGAGDHRREGGDERAAGGRERPRHATGRRAG